MVVETIWTTNNTIPITTKIRSTGHALKRNTGMWTVIDFEEFWKCMVVLYKFTGEKIAKRGQEAM